MPPSASLQRTNTRRRTMKPSMGVFALLSCGTLFQACRLDMESAGPNAHRSVAADVMSDGPEWGPWSTPINLGPVVNSSADDNRPAIRRDGLEIFLSSGRPGGAGNEDLWVSTRASTLDPWSTPVNLGAVVNTTAFDGGPALSFDGTTLYFHSNRPGGFGGNDLYVTTRTQLRGPDVAGDPGVEKQRRRKTHTGRPDQNRRE